MYHQIISYSSLPVFGNPDLVRQSGVTVTVVDQWAGPEGCGTGPPFRLHNTTKQLVVNKAITASPVETVTKLITNGSEPLSVSDHPESIRSSLIH